MGENIFAREAGEVEPDPVGQKAKAGRGQLLAAFAGQHRVKPLFFPETCPTASKALVAVHGRTVESVSVFDLQYQDYSFQENLAREGVDTFAMNHLGIGRSSGLGVINNACNASLPAASGAQTCPAGPGALYDCYPIPSIDQN